MKLDIFLLPIKMYKPIVAPLFFLFSMLVQPTHATDFSELFNQASKSVVTIATNQHVDSLTGNREVNSQIEGTGSGVIINQNGLILTAAHIVNLADTMVVYLNNGESHAAKTVSSFPFADLAVVKIIDPPTDLPVATLGNSDELAIGEEVLVIGSPFGFSQTLTVGHFSGRPVNTGSFNIMDTEFLQTDAAINPGNSGGPMFNTRGEVMGVVSHFRSNASGFGFVASANMASNLFLKKGAIWAGMSVEPMSETLARALNAPFPNGVIVQDVAEGSLAAALGIRAGLVPATINGQSLSLGGDIIVSIGGQNIGFDREGIERAYAYMASRGHGEKIEMVVYRDGELLNLAAAKPLP